MSPKNSVTLVRRRIGRRATLPVCQGPANCPTRKRAPTEGPCTPLPVRHQGEEGTPPGQREQPSRCSPTVTGPRHRCAICVTVQSDPRPRRRSRGARMAPAVYSLLFIEDDDQIRLALRMALEDEGYQVRESADGTSGLAAFDEQEADL